MKLKESSYECAHIDIQGFQAKVLPFILHFQELGFFQ